MNQKLVYYFYGYISKYQKLLPICPPPPGNVIDLKTNHYYEQ